MWITSRRLAPLLSHERQQPRQRSRSVRDAREHSPAACRSGSRDGGRSRPTARRPRSLPTGSRHSCVPFRAQTPGKQRCHADGTRPLDDELRPLEQEHDRLRDIVLARPLRIRRPSARSAEASPPRAASPAIPSAIVTAASTATGRPAATEAANGAQLSTWTPTTRTSGRMDLSAIATPLARPPPPTGTITRERPVGGLFGELEPEAPLPGNHDRIVERVHEHRALVFACLAPAELSDSSIIAPVTWSSPRAPRGLHL